MTDLGHVEGTAANTSTNIQHVFTRLQLQQLHKLLNTGKRKCIDQNKTTSQSAHMLIKLICITIFSFY